MRFANQIKNIFQFLQKEKLFVYYDSIIKRMGEELITCRNYNYINLYDKKIDCPGFSVRW